MTRLERRIREGWPQWFTGPRAAVAEPLLRLLGRWSGLDAAEQFLAASAHLHGFGGGAQQTTDSAGHALLRRAGRCKHRSGCAIARTGAWTDIAIFQ